MKYTKVKERLKKETNKIERKSKERKRRKAKRKRNQKKERRCYKDIILWEWNNYRREWQCVQIEIV